MYKNPKNIDNELGYHPLQSTKKPKIELCFYGRKLKRELVEKRQNRTAGIRLSGVPPYNAYKNAKNMDIELGYYFKALMNRKR